MSTKHYIFNLKKLDTMYAFTTKKSVYELFKKQRDMKVFHDFVFDTDEFSDFEKKSMQFKVDFISDREINNVGLLSDNKNIIPILMTNSEVNAVYAECENIYNTVSETYGAIIESQSKYFRLYKKELKVINLLTDFITRVKITPEDIKKYSIKGVRETHVFNEYINSFKVFYELFGFTMDKNIEIPDGWKELI